MRLPIFSFVFLKLDGTLYKYRGTFLQVITDEFRCLSKAGYVDPQRLCITIAWLVNSNTECSKRRSTLSRASLWIVPHITYEFTLIPHIYILHEPHVWRISSIISHFR